MQIFIAEPDSNLRLGLQMLLHQEAGMHVVGMAIKADGLLVQIEASYADLLIMNGRLPGANMPDLIQDIKEFPAPPKIIVLSVNPELKADVLAAGADAFVAKNAPPDQLLEVIRSVKVTANSTN
jgi:DNA-binding NarL/FixJ family response regulator